jgi:hypothetical protein
MVDILANHGIGETGFINSSSLLCVLNDILINLSTTYSFTQNDLSDILNLLLERGFAVDCTHDTIYMGGVTKYLMYHEGTSSIEYGKQTCPGVTIHNVGECVNSICPPDDSCINAVTYFFDQLDATLNFEAYFSYLTNLMESGGISVFNPDLPKPICCPDCGYYLISGYQSVAKFLEEENYPTICCLSESMRTNHYLAFVNSLSGQYGGVYPKVCCNEFEPCLPNFEASFMPEIYQNGLIETPYYDNHSNLCILTDIVLNLPYTINELSQIIDLILGEGLVVWCSDDYVYVSNVSGYIHRG